MGVPAKENGGTSEGRYHMTSLKRSFALCIVIGVIIALAPVSWAQDGEHQSTKININTASADQLTELKGIGPKYAERIVEYRETHGAFKVAEDIAQIPGIGSKTLEANRDRIVIQ